ncbi:hypothetical protein CC78DRAFT_573020 [Lojkania enalia]|uniref:Uncharacterized protein n=1 Tax=Lojkania enalia TaxID=147567 RepID=A0A9P4K1A6_9PLEO|nr:hypothetical protein CC78DRAFT_573020 [Didymosphaeria enalia]
MCKRWKKKYTCDCTSHSFLDMCIPAKRSNIICESVEEEKTLRKSHFPCYDCIRLEWKKEQIAAMEAQAAADREREKAEEKAKQEKVRREAEERAARERKEDARREQQRKLEAERARKEGGAWVSAPNKKSRGKKGYGSGGGGHIGSPMTPKPPNARPVAPTILQAAPKGVDPGGRAGHWGPTRSKSQNRGGRKF